MIDISLFGYETLWLFRNFFLLAAGVEFIKASIIWSWFKMSFGVRDLNWQVRMCCKKRFEECQMEFQLFTYFVQLLTRLSSYFLSIKFFEGVNLFILILLLGDLDSVNKTTLEHFRGKNVEIRYEMDQDSTDFDKALNLTCRKLTDCPDIEVEGILAMCPLHGRLDHIISQMNSAYQYCKQQKYVYPLYMMSQQSLSWVLPPGKHQIDVSNCDSETCGYVPVFGPVSGITTSGLKYEVTNSTMEMGGLISTSNSFVSDKVEITNDHYLLWIMNFETKNVPNCKWCFGLFFKKI